MKEYLLSRLANGIKVVTHPLPCHFSVVGVFINAGSRYETPELAGVSHILDRLSFKSTQSHSRQEMEEQLLSLGGNYLCTASRESIMYQASTFHKDFEHMVELVAGTVCSPLIEQAELDHEVDNIRYELKEFANKPDQVLPEVGHQCAFSTGLGQPLMCPEERIGLLSTGSVWQYLHRFYTGQRMTVAFAGVSHERSVELAERYFGRVASGDPFARPPRSTWQGTTAVLPLPKQVGNIPVFPYLQVLLRSESFASKDMYAVAVLQSLLGGGGSFSAGGPGKGMYSRLYTQVLNQYGFVENCQSSLTTYADDGLFGIQCATLPEAEQYASYVIATQLAALMDPSGYTAVEVQRAKNQMCSRLLMAFESRMMDVQDLGQQVQLFGERVQVREMIEKVQALDARELARVAQKTLQCEPSIVVMGDEAKFGDVRGTLRSAGISAAAATARL